MSGSELQVSHMLVKAVGISRAVSLLETHQEVTLSAINSAIPTAIHIAEFLKHRVKNLFQENKFERVDDSNKTRVSIHLSLKPLKVDEKGYQAPIPAAEVTEKSYAELKKLPWENPEGEKSQETAGQNWGNRDENNTERRTRGRRGRGRGRWNRASRWGRGGREDRETREPRDTNKNEDRTETRRPYESQGDSENKHVNQEEHEYGENQRRSQRSRRGNRGRRGDYGRDRGDSGRGDFGRRGNFRQSRGGRRGRGPRFGGESENAPNHETKQYTEPSRGLNRGHRRPRGAPRSE